MTGLTVGIAVILIVGCGGGGTGTRATDPVVTGPATAAAALPPAVPSRYPVDDGALVVEVRPDKTRFMASEPVYAEVVFSASGAPIEVEVSWMGSQRAGRPVNYQLVLSDEHDRVLHSPDPGPSFGGQTWTEELATKPYRLRLFVPSFVDGVPAPGRYTIRVHTKVRAHVPAAVWHDVDVATEVPVEITPDDPAALGALIDQLGAIAIGPDADAAGEAITKLGAIRDPRVVPHLVAAEAVGDYSRKFTAIEALGPWDDSRALAALIRAAATPATELPADGYTTEALREESAAQVRYAAAIALSSSPHAHALDALLALKADPEPSIRLAVLHKAATLPDPVGLSLLEAFTKDPDAMVAGEAKRYLSERGR